MPDTAEPDDDPGYPDVFAAGAPADGLVRDLHELAAVDGTSVDAQALLAAIAEESPAPRYASEALGRIRLDPGTDTGDAVDGLNQDAEAACGKPAFDSNAVASVLDSAPQFDGAHVSNAFGDYGLCGGQDAIRSGIVQDLWETQVCGHDVVTVSMRTGAARVFGGVPAHVAAATSGLATVGWVTSTVTPASGLTPPVWRITAGVLNMGSGKIARVDLPTPKVDGAPAQDGDVDIRTSGFSDMYLVSVTSGGTINYLVDDAGRIIHSYPIPHSDGNWLSDVDEVVGSFVHAGSPVANDALAFFDGTTGAFLAVPGFAGSADHALITDGGCDARGLVLTEQGGDAERDGPNSVYRYVKGKLTRDAFADFDWQDADVIGIAPSGVVVTRSDSDGKTYLELLSPDKAHVVWKIGPESIDMGDTPQMALGVIRVVNNSGDPVLVDPATGKQMTGLSAAAIGMLGGDDGMTTGWSRVPGDERPDVYVATSDSDLWVLSAADGVCR